MSTFRDKALRVAVSTLAYGVPLGIIVVPLLLFSVYSLFSVRGGEIQYQLTLSNYTRFLAEEMFPLVLWRTVVLCVAVAAISILVGFPIAYFLACLRGRAKNVFLIAIVVPLMLSYVIKIYSIRSILGGTGILNRALLAIGLIEKPLDIFVYNLNAVLLTLTVLLIPFAVLPIYLSLERVPRNLLEASADLGAASAQTFFRIVVPLAMPGVAGAGTLVFVLALGDFLTPQMVGGQSGFTFGRIIYSEFGIAFNWPFGAALSVIMAFLVILAIYIGRLFGRERAA